MQKTFIGILVLIVIVVLFALQNDQPVQVDFWVVKYSSGLSLVIFLAVTFGALASFLLSIPYRTRKNKEIRERDERIEFLEDEILNLNRKIPVPDKEKEKNQKGEQSENKTEDGN